MRNYILIIGAVVIVAIGIVVYFAWTNPGNVNTSGGSDPGSGKSGVNTTVNTEGFPTGSTITIGTPRGPVVVNNIYKLAQGEEEGTLLLRQTAHYAISYDPSSSSFWVEITSGDIATGEKAAESDLMNLLGVDQAKVCMLNVAWGVLYSLDPTRAGKSYALSFCGGLGTQ